jgi:hypothetical protein
MLMSAFVLGVTLVYCPVGDGATSGDVRRILGIDPYEDTSDWVNPNVMRDAAGRIPYGERWEQYYRDLGSASIGIYKYDSVIYDTIYTVFSVNAWNDWQVNAEIGYWEKELAETENMVGIFENCRDEGNINGVLEEFDGVEVVLPNVTEDGEYDFARVNLWEFAAVILDQTVDARLEMIHAGEKLCKARAARDFSEVNPTWYNGLAKKEGSLYLSAVSYAAYLMKVADIVIMNATLDRETDEHEKQSLRYWLETAEKDRDGLLEEFFWVRYANSFSKQCIVREMFVKFGDVRAFRQIVLMFRKMAYAKAE